MCLKEMMLCCNGVSMQCVHQPNHDVITEIVSNFKMIVHFLLNFELFVPTMPYFKVLGER